MKKRNTSLGKFQMSTHRIRAYKGTHSKRINVAPYDSDYLRVTNCASFRRLQDKTQLFPLEKHDYARSRLTHSCEVAAVGKSLSFCVAKIYSNSNPSSNLKLHFISSVLPTCCLLHDIGNPPFGHYGESIIRKFFKDNWDKLMYRKENGDLVKLSELIPQNTQEYNDFIHFDGNAQSLRCVDKLECFANNPNGLNLTSTVLGGLIKYPYSSLCCKKNSKFGYFKTEENVIKFLTDEGDFVEGHVNPIALLMEAADDISMFCSDIQDSVNKGCITIDDIEQSACRKKAFREFKNKVLENYSENEKQKNNNCNILQLSIDTALFDIRNKLISETACVFYDYYKSIVNCKRKFARKNSDDKHHSLASLTSSYSIIEAFKDIIIKKVYSNKQIIKPEIQGDKIITKLLEEFCDNILKKSLGDILNVESAKNYDDKILLMISPNYRRIYKNRIQNLKKLNLFDDKVDCYERLHLIVDEICGMTDTYAFDAYTMLK